MGSVTNIAQALVDVLLTHADIDYGSVSEFFPAVQAQKIAVLAVPFGQSSSAEPETLDPTVNVLTHRMRLEFWVKHTQGKADVTTQRARDIATEALELLMVNDGTGYELAQDRAEETIDPAMVQLNQASWLVSTLTVPVRNVIAVGD